MFSIEDRKKFAEHELSVMRRNSNGYYCCKVKHSELYQQMTLDMAQFISQEMRLVPFKCVSLYRLPFRFSAIWLEITQDEEADEPEMAFDKL